MKAEKKARVLARLMRDISEHARTEEDKLVALNLLYLQDPTTALSVRACAWSDIIRRLARHAKRLAELRDDGTPWWPVIGACAETSRLMVRCANQLAEDQRAIVAARDGAQ